VLESIFKDMPTTKSHTQHSASTPLLSCGSSDGTVYCCPLSKQSLITQKHIFYWWCSSWFNSYADRMHISTDL